MKALISTTPVVPTMQKLVVSLSLENADDIRWFYHLMNMQDSEIQNAYRGNRLGSFNDRFQPFELPAKKDLFKAVKQHAADNNITL